MALNSLSIDGRLVADAEVRTGQSGKQYTNMRIAYDMWNNMTKEREANYIGVRVFRSFPAKKGQAVLIHGRLEIRQYEKDGERKSYPQILASECSAIQFIKVDKTEGSPKVEAVANAFGGTTQPYPAADSPSDPGSPSSAFDENPPY